MGFDGRDLSHSKDLFFNSKNEKKKLFDQTTHKLQTACQLSKIKQVWQAAFTSSMGLAL